MEFSWEKICLDLAAACILLPFPLYFWLLERAASSPSGARIRVFLTVGACGIWGFGVFQLTYRGLWRFLDPKLRERLRYSSTDKVHHECCINSYSELIHWWKTRPKSG
jgi:hypothetical protein